MLDKYSPAVRQHVDALEQEIERLRDALERPGKDVAHYDVARGQIKGLRWAINQINNDDEDDLTDA